MNLDTLTATTGEWLRGTGPESDIVISTRIRLARNLASFPFTHRATQHQRAEIESLLRDRVTRLDLPQPLRYLSITGLSPLDRQLLVERQLISRELANGEGPRGVAFDEREAVSIMINEEDQLRLQVMRSGLALEQAWHEIDNVDNLLESKVSYAWHEQYGYLTACPTNVGTGLRASVMVHLPAIGLTRQLEKVFRSLQKINLVVRGLYGEGSRASGDFFQISNQITLGRSEVTALSELQGVIAKILQYERQARSALLSEKRMELQDRVSRALGALQHATMMTSDETMELLSSVRLGINLGLLDDISMHAVNELFIQTQPSHLQKLVGGPMDGEERNAARARYLRTRLRQNAT
jgi:protein arginine kinase